MAEALAVRGSAVGGVVALMMHGTGTPLGDPIEVGAATGMHCIAFVGHAATVRHQLARWDPLCIT